MNPLDQLRDEIVNLHLLADRLARKSAPYHDLVEAADAMRALFPKAAHDCLLRECSIVDAYDAARSRHASGAQPDSACDESGWLVEITGPRYWTGTPGCGNWTADSRAAMRFARRQDAEAACRHLAPSGAIPVEHAWVSHRPAGAQPSGAPAPASAQGEVCECGHGVAIHDDRHGDGAHSGSCLEIVGKRSDGSDDFCRCSEFHHAQ